MDLTKLTTRKQIKIALEAKGITPTEIAHGLGVVPAYVYHVIHGRNKSWRPGAMRVRNAVATALGTTPEKLWRNEI